MAPQTLMSTIFLITRSRSTSMTTRRRAAMLPERAVEERVEVVRLISESSEQADREQRDDPARHAPLRRQRRDEPAELHARRARSR